MTPTEHERTGALEQIERFLNRGGEADRVLHDVLRTLFPLYEYVGLRFAEAGERFHGGDDLARYPIVYRGHAVAELEVATPEVADEAFLRRVATLISAYASRAGAGPYQRLEPSSETTWSQ